MASKLYGVNATMIIFVFVLHCTVLLLVFSLFYCVVVFLIRVLLILVLYFCCCLSFFNLSFSSPLFLLFVVIFCRDFTVVFIFCFFLFIFFVLIVF